MYNLQNLLIFHASSTLLGIKPSNLIRMPNTNLKEFIEEYNKKNIFIKGRIVHFSEKESLVLIYNVRLLSKNLNKHKIKKILKQYGYTGDLEEKLIFLEKRLNSLNSFPHEIGLFLGYPLSDVLGFIKKKECKFVGYWKVYGDVLNAKETFKLYNICRNNLLEAFCQNELGLNI